MSDEAIGPEAGGLSYDEAQQRRVNTFLVADLAREFGADNVPEDRLAEIGYVRHSDGTLAPADLVRESREATLADKQADKPFEEPLHVELPASGVRTSMSPNLVRGFLAAEQKISRMILLAPSVSEDDSVFPERTRQVARWFSSEDALPEDWPVVESTVVHSFTSPMAQFISIPGEGESGGYPHRASGEYRGESVLTPYTEDGITLPGGAVAEVSREVEAQRAFWADLSSLRQENNGARDFDTRDLSASGDFDEVEFTIRQTADSGEQAERSVQEAADMLAGLSAQGIATPAQVGLYGLGRLLHSRLPELDCAVELGACGDMEAAQQVMATRMAEVLAQRSAARKTAQTQLREARQSGQGIDEAESQLKLAKKTQKEVATLANGVADILDKPRVLADYFNHAFDGLQKYLLTSNTASVTLSLVSDVDPVLDANPGEVSGDCTDGLPLPFLDPETRLYNIKVKDEDGEHVGGIYLLYADDKEGRTQAWHLDATQIPSYRIDWPQAAPVLLTALHEAAQEKGVSELTVNNGLPLISNYEYVANAFQEVTDEVPESDPLFRVVAESVKRVTQRVRAHGGEEVQSVPQFDPGAGLRRFVPRPVEE
ncbi:MAG TPA: hypothetical protein VK674_01330 [Candidatus Limnocylindria bacterium]|nr:hypothetical protein [Candidatus Limnocylindria bacterium]